MSSVARRTHAPKVVLATAGSALGTALGARILDAALSSRPPSGWIRSNYRGAPVSLTGGASAVLGSVVGVALCGGTYRTPGLIAAVSAASAGAYDDLRAARTELRADKGWRGHVRAARAGRLSGGVVKLAVIGAGALAAGIAAPSRADDDRSSAPEEAAGALLRDAALIAGTANLVNLFDLRPGRAAKVAFGSALVALPGPAGALAASVAGAAAAALPGDLSETRMLGDLGANALGALIGVRLVASPPRLRNTALGVVLALTVASERVSFSAVIESVPALRAIDQWGRRPVEPADDAAAR